MNKERLKLIVRNLDLLVEQLKLELAEDPPKNYRYDNVIQSISDYDEVFDEQ